MSGIFQPRQPELRGKCKDKATAAAAEDPSLRLVRGWYIDPDWGEQEHWWCEREDGEIVDPTVEQFPSGHIPGLRSYREYIGIYPCPGCGIDVHEDSPNRSSGFCCGACYGATVGMYIGRCECA